MEKVKKVRISLWFRIKRLFFGIFKEFRRIQWIKGKTLVEHIITVIILVSFLCGVLYAVYALFINTGLLT